MPDDVLSEVLSAIRLTGSVFFDVTAGPPWVAEAPASAEIANVIRPGAHHAIEYHVVLRGSCWISLIGGAPFEPVRLQPGDIAVIARGEAHVVSSEPGMRAAVDTSDLWQARPPEDLPFKLRVGGNESDAAHLMCGFFTCDVRPFNPLMDALPRFMRIGRDVSPSTHALLDHFLHLASSDISEGRAGAQSVLNKLSELLFIEAIRTYMNELSPTTTGWLAGLRDPLVGRAIRLLHADPARAWTLDVLAAEAGASRSALADKFAHLTGYPPIHYLTRWRMQLAATRLRDRATKVAVVAQEAGYESEAAFSRAFKKFAGVSPTEWRS